MLRLLLLVRLLLLMLRGRRRPLTLLLLLLRRWRLLSLVLLLSLLLLRPLLLLARLLLLLRRPLLLLLRLTLLLLLLRLLLLLLLLPGLRHRSPVPAHYLPLTLCWGAFVHLPHQRYRRARRRGEILPAQSPFQRALVGCPRHVLGEVLSDLLCPIGRSHQARVVPLARHTELPFRRGKLRFNHHPGPGGDHQPFELQVLRALRLHAMLPVAEAAGIPAMGHRLACPAEAVLPYREDETIRANI